MPRYLVERSFAEGLHIPMDAIGAKIVRRSCRHQPRLRRHPAHSYVTPDKTKTYCICDAPPPKPSARAPRPTV